MRNLILALSALVSLSAQAGTIISDAADIARYYPKTMPDAKLLEGARNDSRLAKGGAYQSDLHVMRAPENTDKGVVYHVVALMKAPDGSLFFRKSAMTVAAGRVSDIANEGDVKLADTHFSINTGLEDRLVLVEDAANGIDLAFPLGVGGIDEAVMSESYHILTPKFHGAVLQRKTVTPSRTDPSYYRGRPFMPITTAKGTVTAIAFHITILGDDEARENGLNYLVRGFESHGCMRMREKDLMELFTIVQKGGSDALPVQVDSHVWKKNADGMRDIAAGAESITQVYPTNNQSFMRVSYFDRAPHYMRDEVEHLVVMDRADGQPDFRALDALNPAADMLLPSGEAADEAGLIDNRYDMP